MAVAAVVKAGRGVEMASLAGMAGAQGGGLGEAGNPQ